MQLSVSPAARLRARRGEQGITVLEMVVVTALLSLVIVVVLNALWHTQRSEAYSRGRTVALDEMRTAINRMSKDLRQTSRIVGTPTASRLEVETFVAETPATVVYEASGSGLTRTVSAGTVEIVQNELVSTNVFTYEPDADTATIVKIDLQVKPSNLPDTVLTLSTELDLRNK